MLAPDCAACRSGQNGKRRRAFLLRFLFAGAALGLVQPCAAGEGVFENTGSLAAPHYFHNATLLGNGKVLVSRELYDPASQTWSATVEADANTATLLPNGKVLFGGGGAFNGHYVAPYSFTTLYDPVAGTWSLTGNLNTARYDQAAVLLPNGKVLFAGGATPLPLTSAELYDPASGTWAATGSLANARRSPKGTLLLNGKVLVMGGTALHNDVLSSAELYDPGTGTWTATGSLSTGRFLHKAVLLPNGKVLFIGGAGSWNGSQASNVLASAELYDPASGNWTATGSLSTPRYFNTATLLPCGKVLVTGGLDNTGSYLASAELYDPATGIWTATDSLDTPRAYHSANLLPNGKVLVAGGYNEVSGGLTSAELYVGPATPPTLLNVSTRMRVQTGDKVLIGGFIITGTELKRVLIRGIGPSLNGVGATVSDPTLELHQGSATIATNDNWKMRADASSQQADIEATGIPPSNDSEPAVLAMLNPGAYTAIMADKNGGIGVGLVEVYDLGPGANSQPANISTRGFVDTGDNVMIGGLIVGGGTGNGVARVVVRAIGPSVPIAGALADPTLELRDSSGSLLASNDNWKTRPEGGSQQAEIEATGLAPANDLESALVQTLSAGNYTAIVRGVNDTAGIGLVEAYNLP